MSSIPPSVPASRRTTRLRRVLVALVGALLVIPAAMAAPASALQQDQDRLPITDPVDNTPRVQDGQVSAIARYGNRVFVGGTFTTVQNGGGGANLTRNRLFSYNHLTGQVDAWNPNMNGSVEAMAISPDGRWLYIGGFFSQTDGKGAPRIARFDIATGARDANFKPKANKGVNDIELRGNILYVAGPFDTINDSPRSGLAAVDATTGENLPLNLPLSVPHTSGTRVAGRNIDVTADGSKLVVVGNFRQVAGQDRRQIAMINLDGNGGGSVASNWRTNRYAATCSSGFDSYMHDVEFSPDGSWFGVTTTGAFYSNTLCDTAARFETGATGTDIAPTWVNATGGDTLWGIAITSEAVYIGGHQRWVNNSSVTRGDRAGPGAVIREGIAALDPRTGIPLTWNPGKERGVGTFEITATSDTLFLGHDTNWVNGELRPRLTGFPFGADTNPDPQAIDLPATLLQGRTDGSLRKADVNTGVTNVGTQAGTGINWNQFKGGFYQNGQLWGWGLNGTTFTRRSFDGTTFGAPTDVIAEIGYAVSPPNNFTNVRAAAYHDGRLYYLRSGSSSLYWRWFSLQSGIAGSQEFTANSSSWSSVTGIEIAGGQMYLTRTDGRLYRTTFSGGSVSSSFQLFNSSTNWNSGNDLVFVPGVGGQMPDVTPPSAPGTPEATSTSPGEATITFDAATDDRATQLTYSVYRDGGATPVGTFTGGTTGTLSFTEDGLTPGAVHTWTVRASDGANTGPLSLASNPVVIAGEGGPTLLASDDFSAGLSAWTGVNGLTVDDGSGSPDNSAPSALANPNNGASTARLGLTTPASSSCTAVDVRVSSVTGARYALLKLRTANNQSIARVWIDSGRRLSVRSDITGTRLDSTAVLAPDVWTEVSLCAEVAGAAGKLTLWVNGVEAGSWTIDTGNAPYASLQLGDNDPRTAVIRFDDVKVTVLGEGGEAPDTVPPTAPGKPTAVSTVAGEATVTWAASTDNRATELTYSVYRDGGATPVGTVTGGTTGTLDFTDTDMEPGSIHTWTVRASDGINDGPLSPASDPIAVAGGGGGEPTPLLASSGFSDGLDSWLGVNGLVVDNADGSPDNGAPSALASPNNAASTARLNLSSTATAACAAVDVRFSSVTGSGRYAILKVRSENNASIARIWVDGGRRLSVRNDLTGTRLDTDAFLPADTWAEVALCVQVGGAAGQLTLLVNGVQVGTWTIETGTSPFAWLQLGDNDARTAVIRFDDVKVIPV